MFSNILTTTGVQFPQNVENDALEVRMRTIRDAELAATDKFMVSDFPISEISTAKIKVYRQSLRDLPATLTLSIDEMGKLVLTDFPVAPSV
jgi:hypothetical protein